MYDVIATWETLVVVQLDRGDAVSQGTMSLSDFKPTLGVESLAAGDLLTNAPIKSVRKASALFPRYGREDDASLPSQCLT